MKNIMFLIMKNIIFLIAMIAVIFLCIYIHITNQPLRYFALCLTDALFLAGCWAMIIIEDVKQRLRDKDE